MKATVRGVEAKIVGGSEFGSEFGDWLGVIGRGVYDVSWWE